MTDHSSSKIIKALPAESVTFLSIKEAAERYSKAEITIRRFVRNAVRQEKGTDRQGIHPLPAEAAKLKKGKKPFSYTISSGLLEKHFADTQTKKSATKQTASDPYLSLLESTKNTLERQLQVKDDQIKLLSQAIDDLSQRQRETNILMKGLQEQLLLTSGKDKKRWWQRW
ncbi:hypothetical protein FJZ28_01010 [Candidatus Peregrinibacteria bacterium]|nr:hypothetical protein [Candidatus Peregrinibacteria bacterium]